MPRAKAKSAFKTMYMHTYDGRPARVLRFTDGDIWIFPVSKHSRAELVGSLAAIRRVQEESARAAYRRSKRDFPDEAESVHADNVAAFRKPHGYVLVNVPWSAFLPERQVTYYTRPQE